jgi:hypothetical protein
VEDEEELPCPFYDNGGMYMATIDEVHNIVIDIKERLWGGPGVDGDLTIIKSKLNEVNGSTRDNCNSVAHLESKVEGLPCQSKNRKFYIMLVILLLVLVAGLARIDQIIPVILPP